jgi:uncharacterized protein involved in type VI secretion and phage assembly
MMGLDLLVPPEQEGRFYGVTVGIVTNNKDPDKLGRVKVKLPWLSDQDESHWARVLAPMAGNQRGLYFLPEVDDEVLVAFEQGDISFPYILGALWNGKDKPPMTNDDGKNNIRLIKSRSGHTITLDDTQGEEKIIICDKSQKNEITIDTKNNAMSIKCEKDISIEAKGNISLKTNNGDVAIAGNNIKLEAKQNCEIKANSQANIQATSGMAIKCMAGVKINDGALEVK